LPRAVYVLVGWFIVLNAFQQYFSYIMSVSFIGGGNRSTWRKQPTCRKAPTNLCSDSVVIFVFHFNIIQILYFRKKKYQKNKFTVIVTEVYRILNISKIKVINFQKDYMIGFKMPGMI
jgi:hypothetical protein